ncbi:hypothetical protein BJ546DRAFT_1025767 [Cryomyces antarcticus]|nr:hypothetical protein LTR04_000206 [Oleoguttula sp. CCFEE 6159]
MSLCDKYQQFLANPTAAALADKSSSINYVPTLTTINQPAAIIKHLQTQAKIVKKKSEKVLGAIESSDALSADVEMTVEFLSGGGAYLPQVEENFLADRMATFPMIHIVTFDQDQKIRQIRLYWDQASLIKQVELMGARARSWPIRDGADQARLITSCISQHSATTSAKPTTGHSKQDEVIITGRPHSNSNPTRDPHASLALFGPRDVSQDSNDSLNYGPYVAPRVSAKPQPRDYGELFAGDELPVARSPCPKKNTENGHAPKAGFGKHYARNRLFDENEPGNKMKSPDGIKTNPNKYNHFNFGDGEDVATKASINDGRPTSSKSNKAVASWNFEDFVTPEKVRPKEYPGTTQHIDLFENEDVTSPVKRPVVHQARPDAIPHFEFNDNGTPQGDRKQPIARGRMHSKGMGMYEENIIGDEETDIALNGRKGPLSNVTNVNHGRRNNESHFEMADQSPKPTRKQVAPTDENDEFQHFASVPPGDAAAKKPQRHMDSHWDLYDTSPAAAKKEKRGEIADKGIYKTAGDGMGGRKNASRTWGFGDESDDEANVQAFRAEKRQQAPAEKSFWDFDGQ